MERSATIVQDEIASTKRLLDEIELRQGNSTYHRSLLQFLQQLCDRASEVVNVSVGVLETPGSHPALVNFSNRAIPICCSVVRQVNSYCDSFDYSEPLAVSGVTNQLLSKLLRSVTAHRAFILRGMPGYNYMYNQVGKSLNKLASQLGGNIPALDNSFAILSFPQATKKNVPANVNLVHELGHFIVDAEGLADKLDSALEKGKKDRVAVIVEKSARLGSQPSLLLFAQRKDNNNRILANWIHEMMADAIGLRMLGAAHLMAFLHYEEPLHDYQTDDDEHPCDASRTRLMIQLLTTLEWDKTMKSECPDIWKRSVEISELSRIPNDDFDGPAECLLIIWDDIIKAVLSFLDGKGYKPQTFESNKSIMYGLLERGVPPAETIQGSVANEARVFDAVSIINAGFFFRERGYPSWDVRFLGMDTNERAMLLNRLLTKALEVSFVAQVGE